MARCRYGLVAHESQPAKSGTWGEASVESVLSKCPDGYEARTLPAKTSHAVKVKASWERQQRDVASRVNYVVGGLLADVPRKRWGVGCRSLLNRKRPLPGSCIFLEARSLSYRQSLSTSLVKLQLLFSPAAPQYISPFTPRHFS